MRTMLAPWFTYTYRDAAGWATSGDAWGGQRRTVLHPSESGWSGRRKALWPNQWYA